MDGIDTPREASFATGTRLFVGILAVAHAVAFGSIWVQSAGLIGPSGILPAGRGGGRARSGARRCLRVDLGPVGRIDRPFRDPAGGPILCGCTRASRLPS